MARARPLSPFLTVYRWYPTMATSIVHRVTGVGLALGTLLLAWWLIAVASGPETYQSFRTIAGSWFGQVVLFGFTWALAFHLLNGIRHLVWDMGYGFDKDDANRNSWIIILLSIALAVAAFVAAYTGHGGYGA